ncbi:hypothetical protein ACOMHN_018950 [Nucella lapillus]
MNVGVQTLETIKEWYNSTMAQADPRVIGFPLMQGPERLALVISLYLLVVTQGPRVMAPFKPLEFTRLLVVYNFAMVALATYIFVLTYEAGWWFMFMKIIEFSDTVFFILRKKFSHVTFLHVYHHSTMAVISWVGFKFVPGGQTVMYPLVNSFIHIIMYTYYGMAAMGPHMQKYLWWKRYLTMLQISQFLLLIGQTAVNAVSSCEFPKIFSYTVVFYTFSILVLFLNFYHKAYLRRRHQSQPTSTADSKKTQ